MEIEYGRCSVSDGKTVLFLYWIFKIVFFFSFRCFSVQAMTRTPPVYTVRWSSQISRLNNRLGPPTPAPNAVSSASPTSINIFKDLYSNLYRNNNNHCFRNTRNTNNNNNNIYSYNSSSYVMSIENCNQYKSLTNRLDDVVGQEDGMVMLLSLITGNKLSCLLIVLWIYNFLAIELFTMHSHRLEFNWIHIKCRHYIVKIDFHFEIIRRVFYTAQQHMLCIEVIEYVS